MFNNVTTESNKPVIPNMNNTNLSRFENDGIELYINTVTGESFASAKGYSRMSGLSYSTVKDRVQRLLNKDGSTLVKEIEIQTEQGLRMGRGLTEQLICEWLPKDNPEMATKLMQLGVRSFLHTLAGYQVKSTAVEDARENLENQFLPKVSLKEIDEFATIMGKRFGAAYEQRLLTLNIKKFHSHLAVIDPAPEEKASVSEGEALLTVTQLAEAIGLFYTTGRGDARRLNVILKDLGYQLKIAGQWSATEKAKGLCDRKPVDTNSKTQKDQLMWKATMVDILKEHCIFE